MSYKNKKKAAENFSAVLVSGKGIEPLFRQ